MRWLPLMLLAALPAAAQNDVRDRGAPWVTNAGMPRSDAMGGAHAAVATSNDALLVNPAGLAQVRRYHFELDGIYDARFPAQDVTASIVDGVTGAPVATGLVWSRWGSGQPGGRGEGWLLGLGYSTPIGQSLWFGGTTRYLRFHTPDGFVSKFTQDVGLLARRGNFAWAAVVQNISFDRTPLFPITATAAVAWGTDADWHIAFDYKADLNDTSNVKHRTSGGLEYLLEQALALRGGATWDPGEGRFWVSAGAAILTEKAALQGAWRRQVNGGNDQFFELGVTLYLE
jgi:hypothetical protein